MPRWLAEINKRTFNKLELKRGERPVLRHVGRKSGELHRTPLDAHTVDGGYIFILMYGSGSDWVQNAITAGTATLEIDGDQVGLAAPRVISKEAAHKQLPTTAKPPPDFLNVTEYLQMDLAKQT